MRELLDIHATHCTVVCVMKCARELLDIHGASCLVVCVMKCVRGLLDIHGASCMVVCVMKCVREHLETAWWFVLEMFEGTFDIHGAILTRANKLKHRELAIDKSRRFNQGCYFAIIDTHFFLISVPDPRGA